MDTYRLSVPGVHRYPAGVAVRPGHRLRQMRLWTLVVATVMIVVWLSGSAVAAETGERLGADEGRANFSVTDPEDSCLTHELWLSALVGELMPLGQGGKPSDVSWVYATDHVVDTCTGTEVEYLDRLVDLAPAQVELERLESVSIHGVTVELWSEGGNTLSLSVDLTWTPSGSQTGLVDNAGGQRFQVERFVPAEIAGSAVMNGDLVIPGQPWSGEISHLTQIARPTPISPPDTDSHPTGSPDFVGTGWNNAGLIASSPDFAHGGVDWNIRVFVNYIYTDFLRYSDGNIVRPHTDIDIGLCVYPTDGGDCESAPIWVAGGTNLVGSPYASFTPLERAAVENVVVGVGDGELVVSLEWEAYGDRWHDVQTGDDGVSTTWRRQATTYGTILFRGYPGEHPLSAFNDQALTIGPDLAFDYGEISHSNVGIAVGG
jgi:hypothetical protein